VVEIGVGSSAADYCGLWRAVRGPDFFDDAVELAGGIGAIDGFLYDIPGVSF
jgi:hypothetical protein